MEYRGIPVHPAVMKVASTGRCYDLACRRFRRDPRRPNALRRGQAYGSFRAACLALLQIQGGKKIVDVVWGSMVPDRPLA